MSTSIFSIHPILFHSSTLPIRWNAHQIAVTSSTASTITQRFSGLTPVVPHLTSHSTPPARNSNIPRLHRSGMAFGLSDYLDTTPYYHQATTLSLILALDGRFQQRGMERPEQMEATDYWNQCSELERCGLQRYQNTTITGLDACHTLPRDSVCFIVH